MSAYSSVNKNAAEQMGRKAFLMGIDPLYCDMIVKRWEQFTGGKAALLV